MTSKPMMVGPRSEPCGDLLFLGMGKACDGKNKKTIKYVDLDSEPRFGSSFCGK